MNKTRELYQDAYRIARTSVYGLVIDINVPDAIKNAYVSVGMREESRFSGWTNEHRSYRWDQYQHEKRRKQFAAKLQDIRIAREKTRGW
jgi:hypothetical protein